MQSPGGLRLMAVLSAVSRVSKQDPQVSSRGRTRRGFDSQEPLALGEYAFSAAGWKVPFALGAAGNSIRAASPTDSSRPGSC